MPDHKRNGEVFREFRSSLSDVGMSQEAIEAHYAPRESKTTLQDVLWGGTWHKRRIAPQPVKITDLIDTRYFEGNVASFLRRGANGMTYGELMDRSLEYIYSFSQIRHMLVRSMARTLKDLGLEPPEDWVNAKVYYKDGRCARLVSR